MLLIKSVDGFSNSVAENGDFGDSSKQLFDLLHRFVFEGDKVVIFYWRRIQANEHILTTFSSRRPASSAPLSLRRKFFGNFLEFFFQFSYLIS